MAAAREKPARRSPGAFGLAIASQADIPGLDAPAGASRSRRAAHRLVDAGAFAEALDGAPSERLGGSGEGAARVEYHHLSPRGMLIRSRSFGDHLIRDDGGTILSAVGDVDAGLWQRYVLGQVLPLTASTQGLEIFHASAVAIGGAVVALAGPSGSGKSSLAAALIAGGAAFFTDDVLAVDATAFELVAYPGTTLMGVPRNRAPSLESLPLAGPGWTADERKVLVRVRGERRPLPVRAFVRLTPEQELEEVSFEPCLPNRLMETTFDGVSRGAGRLQRLLRVGAMLAADDRAQELRYPPGAGPEAVAAALRERLDLPEAG
jgi:hypothetical protein